MRNILKLFENARLSLNTERRDDFLLHIDDETREKLRMVFLEMYTDVKCFCDKHELKLFLVGGSALGAVRHQGFIPWDDDLDIGMLRSDFERFKTFFESELGKKYELNSPNTSSKAMCRFTKIFKRGTVLREDTDTTAEGYGIFLDLFIIENIPRNSIVRNVRGLLCNTMQFISGQVYYYENRNPVLKALYSQSGRANYNFRLIIGFFFSFVPSNKWFNLIDRIAQYRYTGLLGCVTGRRHYFGEIFEENVFLPERQIQFCGLDGYVFNHVEIYLEKLYGNYMEIPPENERERHYFVEIKFPKENS